MAPRLKSKLDALAVTFKCGREFDSAYLRSPEQGLQVVALRIIEQTLDDGPDRNPMLYALASYASMVRPTGMVSQLDSKKLLRSFRTKDPNSIKRKLLSDKPIPGRDSMERDPLWCPAGLCELCDVAWKHCTGDCSAQAYLRLGLGWLHFDLSPEIGTRSVDFKRGGRDGFSLKKGMCTKNAAKKLDISVETDSEEESPLPSPPARRTRSKAKVTFEERPSRRDAEKESDEEPARTRRSGSKSSVPVERKRSSSTKRTRTSRFESERQVEEDDPSYNILSSEEEADPLPVKKKGKKGKCSRKRERDLTSESESEEDDSEGFSMPDATKRAIEQLARTRLRDLLN